MNQEIDGRLYQFLRVPDCEAEGMWLEVCDVTDPDDEEQVLSVFHHDPTGKMTVSAMRGELSFALVEEALRSARLMLTLAREA